MKAQRFRLPLPACGERVGVRGRFHKLRLAERPPHPALRADLSPLAGRGGEYGTAPPHAITLPLQGEGFEAGYFGANSWFGKFDASGTLMTMKLRSAVVWQALQPAVIFPKDSLNWRASPALIAKS